jgi:nitronate monooxygenase
MTLTTRLTMRLGLRHLVVRAAMDNVADAHLARAVSRAGGLGLLGGGCGDRDWLLPQLDDIDPAVTPASAAASSRGTRNTPIV